MECWVLVQKHKNKIEQTESLFVRGINVRASRIGSPFTDRAAAAVRRGYYSIDGRYCWTINSSSESYLPEVINNNQSSTAGEVREEGGGRR